MLPTDVYSLTIDELNLFLTRRNLRETETTITLAWRIINFLGGFFSGKLGDINKYLPKTQDRESVEAERKRALVDALAQKGFKH